MSAHERGHDGAQPPRTVMHRDADGSMTMYDRQEPSAWIAAGEDGWVDCEDMA
jgi:hypothetical protein